MSSKQYNIAIVGATGAVGKVMLEILAERKFPVRHLRLLASERSGGKKIMFGGLEVAVEPLTEKSFEGVDIALFSAGAERSRLFAPAAVKSGAVVIDNTSYFRMNPDVPLVVPEVNPEDIKKHHGIIANPNCSTIGMVLALNPIHQAAKINRVVVTTFQSVSGAGASAIQELKDQILAWARGEHLPPKKFAHPIAFNCIPQIDDFLENGYTKEEIKMVNETKKIIGDPSIQLTATCVRVPVFYAHSESVTIETERKLTAREAREILSKAPGVVMCDEPANKKYPMPIYVEGHDETFVGRIREDISHPSAITLWLVSDNLRKGAATNAVQIAEHLRR
ncbi:MAG: aspartate-semialdehyde dehydrogenase [Candidatus Omnitrophica bacterium]|nr:aspartate-semialdehyde dehydrogenase [Candidatus Omnitrophota bacterium]